jgi:FMN-dependent NADH-azoreductase
MKKLLYITANSKEEKESSCKTVGRKLVNAILRSNTEIQLQELDLYKEYIPQLKGCYFEGRSAAVSNEARIKLSSEEQREVQIMENLCDQFRDADIYVLAAPMWSLAFPAPVKEYIDCIIQVGKTIKFKDNKPQGLLGNKDRIFIYVQSSGANIPWILRPALNKGINYVEGIMKLIGIDRFEELLVDGTGTTEEERQKAIQTATEKINDIVSKL